MREIILTQGKVALVDDKDYDRVSQFKWCVNKAGNCWYAVRRISGGGKRTTRFMHRFILGFFKKELIDHVNGNGLDNRRRNLRICNHSQNVANSHKFHGRSKYKGISRHREKWQASIRVNGIGHYLGLYNTELEAAKVYDRAAVKFFGEFAFTNGVA